jgi:hypothetical protein
MLSSSLLHLTPQLSTEFGTHIIWLAFHKQAIEIGRKFLSGVMLGGHFSKPETLLRVVDEPCGRSWATDFKGWKNKYI